MQQVFQFNACSNCRRRISQRLSCCLTMSGWFWMNSSSFAYSKVHLLFSWSNVDTSSNISSNSSWPTLIQFRTSHRLIDRWRRKQRFTQSKIKADRSLEPLSANFRIKSAPIKGTTLGNRTDDLTTQFPWTRLPCCCNKLSNKFVSIGLEINCRMRAKDNTLALINK